MKQIKLKNGNYTLVDDDNFEWLNRWSWSCNNGGYVTRRGYGVSISMHREVNKTPKGLETDHIDGDRLNNRRSNLRTVTHSQNQMHHRIPKNNTHGVKGVYWDKVREKWLPRVKIYGKSIYLGIYSDFELAKKAREEGERRYYQI